MKKYITMIIVCFLTSLSFITPVSANTVINYYSATVPKRQTGYTAYENASYNYVYAMNKLTSSAGKAAIHTIRCAARLRKCWRALRAKKSAVMCASACCRR